MEVLLNVMDRYALWTTNVHQEHAMEVSAHLAQLVMESSAII